MLLGLLDVVGTGVGVRLREGDRENVRVVEPVKDREQLGEPLRVTLVVMEGLGLRLRVWDREGVRLPEALGPVGLSEDVEVGLRLMLSERVLESEWEGVELGLPLVLLDQEWEEETEQVAVREGEALGVPAADWLGDHVGVRDWVAVARPDVVEVRLRDWDGVPLLLGDRDLVRLGDGLHVFEQLCRKLGVSDRLEVAVWEGEKLVERVLVTVRDVIVPLRLGEQVPVNDGVPLPVPVAVLLRLKLGLCVAEKVRVIPQVGVCEGLLDGLRLALLDKLRLPVLERLQLSEGEDVADRVDWVEVLLGVNEGELEGLLERVWLAELERLWDNEKEMVVVGVVLGLGLHDAVRVQGWVPEGLAEPEGLQL